MRLLPLIYGLKIMKIYLKTEEKKPCTHPFRVKREIDCGDYIAVMIYCRDCGAFITQINKYKDGFPP